MPKAAKKALAHKVPARKVPSKEVTIAAAHLLTPDAMLDRAVSSNASLDVVERLMALKERYDLARKREAFDAAMADVKESLPVIKKNRKVGFVSERAGVTNAKVNYQYEDLAAVVENITPILSKHGLSHRFRTKQEGPAITVTCIIAHRNGHAEENSLTGAPDTSGSKNAIQAIGSTITYLQRYTLKAALGIAAAGDDDGNTSERSLLTEEQIEKMRAKIKEVGSTEELVLAAIKQLQLADIYSDKFDAVMKLIESKSGGIKK